VRACCNLDHGCLGLLIVLEPRQSTPRVVLIVLEPRQSTPRVDQILLDKSCVLLTCKKICKVKKSPSPTVWHNPLAKSRSNLHQES
jgi:hypothetical protein